MKDDIIVFPDNSAFLTGAQAIVTFTPSSRDMFKITQQDKDIPHLEIANIPKATKDRKIVRWGEDNDLPEKIVNKIYKTPVLTSGMLFNIEMTYGEGILPVFIDYTPTGEKKVLPYELLVDKIKEKLSTAEGKDKTELNKQLKICQTTLEEIETFREENDLSGWLLEQVTDLNFFYNVFCEIGFNLEDHGKRKIVEIVHKEAVFSRWEEMNPKTGVIEKHYYCTKWGDEEGNIDPMKDVGVTPVLDVRNPVRHIKKVIEQERKENTKPEQRQNRWIVPVSFPTPGRTYYQKPYWYSIIESGWYDFAVKIPEAKNALMENKMMIKYHIELDESYFPRIFKQEGITDEKKRKERVKKEYANVTKFLTDSDNKGKTVFSYSRKDVEGKDCPDMKITVVENAFSTGEYIEDSEEVSNILSYGIGVHPSIIGSSPGKNKSINGTEARELFLIKQTLTKPIRDRILRPLYVIKAVNGWDPKLHFIIPNMVLTTLDKDKTGTTTKTE
jgi:hypothetical protein